MKQVNLSIYSLQTNSDIYEISKKLNISNMNLPGN